MFNLSRFTPNCLISCYNTTVCCTSVCIISMVLFLHLGVNIQLFVWSMLYCTLLFQTKLHMGTVLLPFCNKDHFWNHFITSIPHPFCIIWWWNWLSGLLTFPLQAARIHFANGTQASMCTVLKTENALLHVSSILLLLMRFHWVNGYIRHNYRIAMAHCNLKFCSS